MRSFQDLRREQSSVDADLERMMRYVVNELGVPSEDAREVAEQRLGRRHSQPTRRRQRGPLDQLGEDIRRGQQVENRRHVQLEAPRLPFSKTLNIGGARASVIISK